MKILFKMIQEKIFRKINSGTIVYWPQVENVLRKMFVLQI